ncbi:MAG: NAD(P)-dependent glycerol-3-phosphate dehydrogenase [SAR202 cluster bacterium]|nr:NAD(P)-dependent glycerol-3-phosphate dehydrogenase [SAR202 cluster bacterium]
MNALGASTAIVGTTTWGTTLALTLARRGLPVLLLARSPAEAARLEASREHGARLPGQRFPPSMRVTADATTLADAAMVVFAVPSQTLRRNARELAPRIPRGAVVISACKGLEQATAKRMSVVLREELGGANPICALSGPNLAHEIVLGLPASTVVASADDSAALRAQALINSNTLRVYTNSDVVGTELGGALKNIISIGAGICDGLRLGDNAKAGFVGRGLAEITRLGVAAGAHPLTFAGLAGLGDLIATCYSALSRNHRVGAALARGLTLQQALNELGGEVAEGVSTTPAALDLAKALGVEMPITETTRRVLFEGLGVRDAIAELMGRAPKPEHA